jgi:hypothetical protein
MPSGPVTIVALRRIFIRLFATDRGPSTSVMATLLVCRAIELELKAYLAFHGATRKVLTDKKLGHNLTELLTKRPRKG